MERITQKESTYYEKALSRLQELENKSESGLMIELPCKVGDTVYCIVNMEIEEIVCESIEIDSEGIWVWGRINAYHITDISTDRKEAEEKLKEILGEEQNVDSTNSDKSLQ